MQLFPIRLAGLWVILGMLTVAHVPRSEAATIVGGSDLMTQTDANQLEALLNLGPVHLIRAFVKRPGDGKTAADLHAAVDYKGQTLTLYEVLATQGNPHQVIGGYDPQFLNSGGNYNFTYPSVDRTGFLFNLATSKVMAQNPGANGEYQTFNSGILGPTFGILPYDLTADPTLSTGNVDDLSYGSGSGSLLNTASGLAHAVDYGEIEVFTIWQDGAVSGPYFPSASPLLPTLPEGDSWTQNPVSVDGAIGKAGGQHWIFSNVALSATNTVYWGLLNNQIRMSFDGDSLFRSQSGGAEVFTFNAASSDLNNGVLSFFGTSFYPTIGALVTITFTATVTASGNPVALVPAASVGLPANMGGVIPITAPTQSFDVLMLFSANGMGALDYFNSLLNPPTLQAFSSVTGGYFYANTPPTITGFADVLVQQGQSSNALAFTVQDEETAPTSLAVSATSSIPLLVPPGNIVIAPVNTSGVSSLVVTPNGNLTGTTLITVTVTDGGGGNAQTSFHFTVNDPPSFTTPDPFIADQRTTAVILPTNLHGTDSDGPDSQITYVLVGGPSSVTQNGVLAKSGVPLNDGDTFTQQDIDDGKVTYAENVSDTTGALIDGFQFWMHDSQGGTHGGPTATADFPITIRFVNRPPVAQAGSASVGLGAVFQGQLVATDADIVSYPPPAHQPLTYAITVLPQHGTLTLSDANLGTFTYQAPMTPSSDTFQFKANDGIADSAAATFSLTTSNLPPQPTNATVTTKESQAVTGALAAVNPNAIAETFTFRVGTQPANGSVSVQSSGAFNYTPNLYFFGADTFTFIVNNGTADSAPGTETVVVRPILRPGDLFTGGKTQNVGTVALLDLVANKQFVLASGPGLGTPQGLAVETAGTLLVSDSSGETVQRLDPNTGVLTPLVQGYSFVVGVLAAANGEFYVADAMQGVFHYDHSGTQLAHFSGGNLQFPVAVAFATDGSLLVGDAGALNHGTSKIVKIDSGGTQTVVSTGASLTVPAALVQAGDGSIYIADAGGLASQPNQVIVTKNGVPQVLASGAALGMATGLVLSGTGNLIVVDDSSGKVLEIPASGGSPATLFATGLVAQPFPLAQWADQPPTTTPPAPINVTAEHAHAVAITSSDPDNGPRPVSVVVVAGPQHGTLNADASVYTPATGYTGADSFTYQASDGLLNSATATVSLQVQALTLQGPAQTTSPAVVASPVSFTATAGGIAPLSVHWDFGDGNTIDSSQSPQTHAFNPAGSYVVTVTATDGNNISLSQTVSVTVEPLGFGGPPVGIDSDADGFSDELELALGSNPLNQNSTPFGTLQAVVTPFGKLSALIKLNFKKSGSDAFTVTGSFPVDAAVALPQQNVALDVGGAASSMAQLDSKGSFSGGGYSFKFKAKAKKGAVTKTVSFSIKLAKASIQNKLADDGLTNLTVKKGTGTVKIILLFNQKVYTASLPVSYAAKAGASLSAKGKQ